jgi:hypothetical protein
MGKSGRYRSALSPISAPLLLTKNHENLFRVHKKARDFKLNSQVDRVKDKDLGVVDFVVDIQSTFNPTNCRFVEGFVGVFAACASLFISQIVV